MQYYYEMPPRTGICTEKWVFVRPRLWIYHLVGVLQSGCVVCQNNNKQMWPHHLQTRGGQEGGCFCCWNSRKSQGDLSQPRHTSVTCSSSFPGTGGCVWEGRAGMGAHLGPGNRTICREQPLEPWPNSVLCPRSESQNQQQKAGLGSLLGFSERWLG